MRNSTVWSCSTLYYYFLFFLFLAIFNFFWFLPSLPYLCHFSNIIIVFAGLYLFIISITKREKQDPGRKPCEGTSNYTFPSQVRTKYLFILIKNKCKLVLINLKETLISKKLSVENLFCTDWCFRFFFFFFSHEEFYLCC